MRALLIIGLLGLGALPANAQEQERKLLDRLLKPDTSLTNRAQDKQFVIGGSTLSKPVHTKSFYVADRPPEKEFRANRNFAAKKFATAAVRDAAKEAWLLSRTSIAKTDQPYSTSAYAGAKTMRDSDKVLATSEFAGTRPFLVRGKSQKALSAQDRPLTIDQVRELLNKNK